MLVIKVLNEITKDLCEA